MPNIRIKGVEHLNKRIDDIIMRIPIGINRGLTEIGDQIRKNSLNNLKGDVGSPWPRKVFHKSLLDEVNWVVTDPEFGEGYQKVEIFCDSEHALPVEYGTGIIRARGTHMTFKLKDGSFRRFKEVKGQPPKVFFRGATTLGQQHWASYINALSMSIFRELVR